MGLSHPGRLTEDISGISCSEIQTKRGRNSLLPLVDSYKAKNKENKITQHSHTGPDQRFIQPANRVFSSSIQGGARYNGSVQYLIAAGKVRVFSHSFFPSASVFTLLLTIPFPSPALVKVFAKSSMGQHNLFSDEKFSKTKS